MKKIIRVEEGDDFVFLLEEYRQQLDEKREEFEELRDSL